MRKKVCLPRAFVELEGLGRDGVRELWFRYFKIIPAVTREKLLRILWHKIQCENLGLCIQKKNITRLKRYSVAPDEHIEKSHKKKYYLRSGMVIVKKFKGREHRVTVQAPGEFVYDNKTYKSLSAVAFVICGNKVSGNSFFGLDNKLYQKCIIKAEDAA